MINHKIVFSGPVGAGKSTAIRSLSDAPTIITDVTASDDTSDLKDLTTVALDHGAFDLDNGDRVHLFGTPGQDRFDFMWEILSEGATGLVLLVANDSPDPVGDLRSFLGSFESLVGRVETVVGVTRSDRSPRPSLDDHRAALAGLGLHHVPVVAVDARRADDVRKLVLALLPAGQDRVSI